MPKSGLHTVVVLGLSTISIPSLQNLLDENPLPLPCLLLQPEVPYALWPDYSASVRMAQDIACAAAVRYRAPLCIGVMHGIYGLCHRPTPGTYSPAAVVEVAARVEWGEIIDKDELLNPVCVAKALYGRQVSRDCAQTEPVRQLAELLRRRQSALM